ncbi:MAG: hypothetical protein KR126chlam5_01184 [Candidatus Anoxychlamydiales bacterium]|nr:hypothetical protein [Candidatus Anoxychlamydiales bacterium]
MLSNSSSLTNSRSSIFLDHSFIPASVVIGLMAFVNWRKSEAVVKISAQAFKRLKQCQDYADNILKYNKRELFVTLVLAGSVYTCVNSNLAMAILISGASYIAGKRAQTTVNRNIETREAIREDAVQKKMAEKDTKIQELTKEQDKLKRENQSLVGSFNDLANGIVPLLSLRVMGNGSANDEKLKRVFNRLKVEERKILKNFLEQQTSAQRIKIKKIWIKKDDNDLLKELQKLVQELKESPNIILSSFFLVYL